MNNNPLRLWIRYTPLEWSILEEVACQNGFPDVQSFLRSRTRLSLDKLQITSEPTAEEKDFRYKTYPLYDKRAIEKLQKAAEYYNITPVNLIKRLVTEPILAKRLLEGPSDF